MKKSYLNILTERKPNYGQIALRLTIRLLIILCCFTVVYPIIWYLFTSVRSSASFMDDPWAFPDFLHLQFSNYWEALTNTEMVDRNGNTVTIITIFANTLFTSLLGTFLLLVMSSALSFILCKYSFPGKKLLKVFFTMAMVIPSILLIVPLYTQLTSISPWFKNNLIVVGVIYACQSLPIQVFLLTNFVNKINNSLIEAARMDGASEFKVFFRVILPSIKPILFFIGLTSFMGNWNEYTVAKTFLTDDKGCYTLSIGLEDMKIGALVNNHYGTIFAGFFASTLVILILYAIFQKQIIHGIDMSEGVKE